MPHTAMVVQQSPQLGPKGRHQVETHPQGSGVRGFVIHGLLQLLPLGASQAGAVIVMRQAQATFGHQAVGLERLQLCKRHGLPVQAG